MRVISIAATALIFTLVLVAEGMLMMARVTIITVLPTMLTCTYSDNRNRTGWRSRGLQLTLRLPGGRGASYVKQL
eukprot:7618802-Alexandrium_andersonii.AAC.1